MAQTAHKTYKSGHSSAPTNNRIRKIKNVSDGSGTMETTTASGETWPRQTNADKTTILSFSALNGKNSSNS
jgi:hypothetical protein